ncbi:metal ABC transporter ATP-binding protein [Sporolactobacillus shoreicorticis]|uniref:Metal ABC transporter ATP-binding protein n=1 Tax=Sporolactobacillus shoreicorticis TaxID=1923877 RepID=A0ABW5S2B8_9BACL|nr:metal ABC transporter ATP-binding protein [Sporolactobacillus shoreicorticis]MCO7128291.1 metal ABC transporter ATP-binding protein [Sporolactobacillus shoreicorticis]
MEISNLSVYYGKRRVLNDVSVSIRPGKVTGIIGPNGAGKSTLMKAVLGLIPMSSGTITMDSGEADPKKWRLTIAYVPQRQSIDLTFPITVFDMVMMGTYPSLGLFKRPGKAEKAQTQKWLEAVKLGDLGQRQIAALSGGQLQRAIIARALVQETDIFFLDEPFAGVDVVSEQIIMDLVRDMNRQGKTFVVVHHDLSTVKNYFDDVVLLHSDHIVYGEVGNVFTGEQLKHFYGAEINF